MSELKTKIQDELKVAMKAREQLRVTTLRGLMAEIKQVEVDTREGVSDEKILTIIQKEIKKRRDAIGFAEKADRAELVEANLLEIDILQGFLGAQFSEDELKGIIETLIKDGADSIGKVMGALNKEHKGKFEGQVASQITKSLLG